MLEPEHFESTLAEAERAPADVERFSRDHLGYIDDVVEALSWCAWNDDSGAEHPTQPFDEEAGRLQPVLNPWRDVGRNDPCPCGSGRKYKKCCISAEGAGVLYN